MKQLIDPLTRIPGVRTAALITTDGVLMAMHSSADNTREGSDGTSRENTSPSERSSLDG